MPKIRRTRPIDPTAAIGYVRTSTGRQENGLNAQRDQIARYAAHHGLRLIAVHQDAGVSGASVVTERDGFNAAVAEMRETGAGVLLIAKRDRLARDLIQSALATRLIERLGSRVTSADGSANGDGPEAVLMRQMLDAFAQFERALIAGRTRAALAARRARGLRFTHRAPYGYRWDRHGMMRPVARQMETWSRIRRLRSRGLSYRKIAARLHREGRRPAHSMTWQPSVLRALCLREPGV